MKYDYAGGVLPEERPVIDRFEADVLPYVQKNGPWIGEAAMQGDMDAEEVIRRYNLFVNGMPHLRPVNLRICIAALKRWDAKRVH